MPRCDTHIYEAHQIANGSTIELWTEGKAGEFDTVALIEADDRRWTVPHSRLFRPAGDTRPPESFPAVSPQRYVVTFFTNFRSAADTEPTFNVRIVSGAASRFPQGLPCSVVGKLGDDEDHRIVFLKTVQS